jgi:amino acid transporter
MDSAEVSSRPGSAAASANGDQPHLKADAISFVDGLAIALASTAPAYSLAAVIGSIVVLVGLQAPAALLVAFVPMFFIAAAFYYMNKADQDCGTCFAWVTRAIGPRSGWMTGWAICVTGILVVGSLADVAASSFFDLIGADGLMNSTAAVTGTAVLLMIVMTAVCVWGTEISANLQKTLMVVQIVPLILFIVVALVKVWSGHGPAGSIDPSVAWLNPFEIPAGALSGAMLLAVFIYWGWESAVNLNEETEGDVDKPGLAGLISTALLLLTYVGVAFAIVAWGGVTEAEKFDDNAAILATYAKQVLGGTLGLLVLLSVVVSALASTQTTILPSSRTSLSMARAEAMPEAFGRISRRFFTPVVSTTTIGALAILWYVPAKLISENFLLDSLSALSLMIAFYYALTGYACAFYYRRELLKSVRNLLFIGVAPLIGAAMLTYLFVKSLVEWSDPANSASGSSSWLGFAPPAIIGVGFLVLGAILLYAWRRHRKEPFFGRRQEVADPGLLTGRADPATALASSE